MSAKSPSPNISTARVRRIQQYAFKAIVNDGTIQYVHTDIGGGKVFRSLQLANCIISSVNSDGGTQERPKEYLTLNFTEITVTDMVYTDQDFEGYAKQRDLQPGAKHHALIAEPSAGLRAPAGAKRPRQTSAPWPGLAAGGNPVR